MTGEREEEGNGRGFRVVDRRRFTVDGDLRDGVSEVPEKEESVVAAAESQEPPLARSDVKAESETQEEPAAPQSPEEERENLLFVAFLKSLVTQGMMQLGVVPHPATGQPEMHLEGAQETIEILAMLKGKTSGNLTEEEDQLVNDVLNQLGLIYNDVMQKLTEQAMQNAQGGPGQGGPGPGGIGR
ncbi:MAG: DUF1844 domain-containing protein [Deltaproteobacteria bacterium]|nr:DUF1844 domain-containing protein [Deltaproteobacteria bacterium]